MAATKSALLLVVSVQPFDLRMTALVLLAAGAGALPLKHDGGGAVADEIDDVWIVGAWAGEGGGCFYECDFAGGCGHGDRAGCVWLWQCDAVVAAGCLLDQVVLAGREDGWG